MRLEGLLLWLLIYFKSTPPKGLIGLQLELNLLPFHVTLVGADDDAVVLTELFFVLLVCFSGASWLISIEAASGCLHFWYPFGPFFHVTLACEDGAIVLTK